MVEKKIKLAILASGRGSNALSIIKHFKSHRLIEVSCLISNKKDAPVLSHAQNENVKKFYIPHSKNIRDYEDKMLSVLHRENVDYVILAGFMRILSPYFIEAFKNKIINIHPSLLPLFPGKSGYEDAYAAKVRESGFTVHLVDEGVDTGVIIAQRKFPLLVNESLEDFKKRGLLLENESYPGILEKYIIDQKETRGHL